MPQKFQARGKWKPVKINSNVLKKSNLEGLVSLEELTDYTVIEDNEGKAKEKKVIPDDEFTTKQKRKRKQKRKSNTPLKQCDANDDEISSPTKKSTSKKKGLGKFISAAQIVDLNSAEDDKETKISLHIRPDKKSVKRKSAGEADKKDEPSKKKKKKSNKTTKEKLEKEFENVEDMLHKDVDSRDMSAWKNLLVPEPVLEALKEQGFTEPTPIQIQALPSAIRDRRDIIGAAETGSGKTLAFGIPLLNLILKLKDKEAQGRSKISSQTKDDEDASAEESESDEEENDLEIDPPSMEGEVIELPIIAPGEDDDGDDYNDDEDYDLPPDEPDEDKQLEEHQIGCVRTVHDVKFDWLEDEDGIHSELKPLYALVLTPTRELAIQVRDHIKRAAKNTDIQCVTVVGGMSQQKQERLLKRGPEIVVATPGRLWELYNEGQAHLSQLPDIRCLVIDEADRMVEKGHFQELEKLFALLNEDEAKKKRRQTFVFSATLTFVHQAPQRMALKKKRKKNFQMTQEKKLEMLISQIGMKDKPKIIDLTQKQGTAATLTEARINCNLEEKDFYLYYFLQQYPQRTLVFCNSKDALRRLLSVFTLLKCNPLPLHADMHQRQRLKNLDRFRDSSRGLLLATDVAARGLDIPGVEHVIHYQVPRTTENYVHRSGRTARASKEGLSVMLVGPDDLKDYRKIIKALNRDEDLPLFPVESEFVTSLKPRVSLARSIDVEEHKLTKMKTENSWFQKAAKAMDIELEEDELLNDLGDSRAQSQQNARLQSLRAQLTAMLSLPLINKHYSGKYPTKMGKLVLPYMSNQPVGGAVSHVKADKSIQKAGPTGAATTKVKAKKQKFKKRHKKTKK